MTLHHRTLTYVQLRSIDIAVNEQNAVCGIVIPLDDKYIVQGLPPPKEPHRAFERHMVNGQPKPMSEYFIDPEMQAILSQTKSRSEQRRLS